MLCRPTFLGRRPLAGLIVFVLLSGACLRGAPAPVGLWEFDDAQNLLQAATGTDLQLHGTHTAIAGPWAGNGAARIGTGSDYTDTHAYLQPGTFEIRALPRDARGQAGVWTRVQTISVTGPVRVRYLTAPYLQNVRTNAIAILWELNTGVEAAVEYGLDTGYGVKVPCTHQSSGAGTEIYRCMLTHLQPGTTYQFRALADGQPGPAGAFTTAPAQPVSFSFSVWSDSQGSNHGTYDTDPLEPTKSMFRHMAASGIQFAVTCGDLAESGATYADTREYYLDRAAALLGPTVPWFVAWGNHDGAPTTVIRRFADLPSQQRAGYHTGYGSYSFDYAGCHFIWTASPFRATPPLIRPPRPSLPARPPLMCSGARHSNWPVPRSPIPIPIANSCKVAGA